MLHVAAVACLYTTRNYELIFHLDYKSLGAFSHLLCSPSVPRWLCVCVCVCAVRVWLDLLPNKRLHALQSNGKPITFLEVWREPHSTRRKRKKANGNENTSKVCNRIVGATMWLALPFIVISAQRSLRLQFSTPHTHTHTHTARATHARSSKAALYSSQSSVFINAWYVFHTNDFEYTSTCVGAVCVCVSSYTTLRTYPTLASANTVSRTSYLSYTSAAG